MIRLTPPEAALFRALLDAAQFPGAAAPVIAQLMEKLPSEEVVVRDGALVIPASGRMGEEDERDAD